MESGASSLYTAGPNGFFTSMMLLQWWGLAFDRKAGGIVTDMSDALRREEKNIWHEHVDNVQQFFASALGRCKTRGVT